MNRKISTVALAATALGLGSPGAFAAAAKADPMANFYANTMLSRHEDGKVFNVYFNRDRSFLVTQAGKTVKQGTYTLDQGKMCMIENGKVSECPPFRTDLKVGETWDAVTPKGKHDILTLQAGRAAEGRARL